MYWQLFGFLQVLLVVLMAYSHLLQRIFGPRPIVVGLEEDCCPWLVQQVIRAFGVLADLEKKNSVQLAIQRLTVAKSHKN